jgi:hypothetical protein
VYRDGNKVADWLANLGCNLINGSILYELPPREVQSLVDDDVLEVTTSKMIIKTENKIKNLQITS